MTRVWWVLEQAWLWYVLTVWIPLLTEVTGMPWLGPLWVAVLVGLWLVGEATCQ